MTRDLGHVLDAILAGVIVLDERGRVERVNAACCRMLECSPDAVQGAEVERLHGPQHPLATLARGVLAKGPSASQGDVLIERHGGEHLHVDVAASPLFSEHGGELEGAVLVLRDRTLQRRLEQLEQERERQEVFGRIAAGLAHEVKNPLGGIRGAGELLGRRSNDPKTREIAELIVREATRIATLVDDFMVFGREEKLDLAPVNLHEVLDRALDLLVLDPLAARAQLERRFDPSIPPIWADADRLEQVFLNLARNALQALPEAGGTLRIETRTDLTRHLGGPDGKPLAIVAVSFRDDGPGMPDAVRRRATTPFFTTRPGGTGLGLAVAEYWVSRHGGRLEIESTPARGTCVMLELPLRRTA